MSTQTAKKHHVVLEDSRLWQLAAALEGKVRQTVKTIPFGEHYRLFDGPISNADYFVVAIAKIVGKGPDASAFDYRYARAELFAVKGMLLVSREHGFLPDIEEVIDDIDTLQAMIEKELTAIENKAKTDKK
jgi:hypothetical protein